MKKSDFERINVALLADRVIVKEQEAEEISKGGIIIPSVAREKETQGKVVMVGKGTKEAEMLIKVGDTAIYGKYGGVDVDLDGETYKIMRQTEVFLCLDNEENSAN